MCVLLFDKTKGVERRDGLVSRLDGSLCSILALLWTLNATGLSTVNAETLGAFLYNFGQIDAG
ncbi:uncharacterized protein Bfra_005848 [Botrytis fragariae]|uniref:Uncharacterized protein n=1 Tax=Botrytis fragariae TaxID=1964551 RepID=A0A8H6ARW1_9HELO|nr:uncharacterized protein Bfra_005848 [Botrytis fragariae]KAF5872487.1 hypothetical protein Bfra_005848 [Botrytis fragariae]